jgi:hypothetical protein
MRHKTIGLALVTILLVLGTSTSVQAWGAYHAGYTHFGPSGVYHYGRTSAYGPYGGYSGAHVSHYGYGGYGGYGAYHGEGGYPYHSVGGYGSYGGYHYNAGYESAYRYGGYYGSGYRGGYYRRW